MRVLFLNTSDIAGGAAIAAMRLATAFEKYYDVESFFLVSEKFSDKKNVIQTRPKWLWFLEKSYNKIACYLGYQYFFIPFSSWKILKEAKKFKPDVIHLHNIHGGYIDFRTVEKLSKIAPIVWTLHDAWIATSHCAYPFECEGFESGCLNCKNRDCYPFLLRNFNAHFVRKKKMIREIKPLIITPSLWLKKLVKNSEITENCELEVISNCIDIKLFKKSKDLEPGKLKTILFSAAKTDDYRKGGDLLNDLIDRLDKELREKVNLVIVGKCDKKIVDEYKNIDVQYVGTVAPEKLPDYYSLADIYIMLSRSDNQPLTIIEAMSCGIPIVAFDVGGIPELVIPGKTGELVKPFDMEDFVKKVTILLNDDSVRENYSDFCRKYVEENCYEKMVAKLYYLKYKNHLK